MTSSTNDSSLQWWREARFGLFIHWGVYAVPAGTWQGQQIPSLGEWIMRNAKIPIAEYEALGDQFNPVKFSADEWVRIAAQAGMKYLVITSKHHDGFCMFRSPSNPYNIVDATPFDRDPMAELAKACAKYGLKLCFYYSQAQDWHAPGGAGHWEEANGKGWHSADSYTRPAEDFAQYLEDVVKPNLQELLTQYGPIGLIWFDTPVIITREQSEDLRDYVHSLQPNCLVSGRVGHDVGDYGSMGDNQIPVGRVQGDWETPATLNDTWGYKDYDHNWKSADKLIYLLVDLASKGVNYLLNVGPTGEGLIPQPSIDLLREIGGWMDINGEAIHGSQASPYPYEFDWGRLTQKGNALYLLVTSWPADGALTLPGLRSQVLSAQLLADPAAPVEVQQTRDGEWHETRLVLPASAPGAYVSVLKLELDGGVDVDASPLQQADGRVVLPAHMAATTGGVSIDRGGMSTGWRSTEDSLAWSLRIKQGGRFRVEFICASAGHGAVWKGGHEVAFNIAGHTVAGLLVKHRDSDSPRAQHHPEAVCVLGEVELPEARSWDATVQALGFAEGPQLRLAEIQLVPLP
ncbi:MAG: alpha-L-fucosidase [Victivallales bacterium]|nr:alpha-L-fucosidase [Victivallales bacterium]